MTDCSPTKRLKIEKKSSPTSSIARTSMDDIPRAVLGEIFNTVPVIAANWINIKLVCKRWKEVGDSSLDPRKFDALNRLILRNAREDRIIYLLKDTRVDPSKKQNHAIRWAAVKGYFQLVKILQQDPRVDPSAVNNQALQQACSKGHLKIVDQLLQDKRVDPAAFQNYAIQEACRNGHVEVVKRLLKDPRVDPNQRRNQAIREASFKGLVGVVAVLLEDSRVDPGDWINLARQRAQQIYREDVSKGKL
eukprot:TRINITY_DN8108_c0_g1_i1.p1 TRINITY_DN8108_c0_g1~~TRINITY_DN8108_c0_g1_i1.p1  ORF type:complete len:248 (-),score=54.50 TRINITY_DN8108_c0_g1_i1:79-822(-)